MNTNYFLNVVSGNVFGSKKSPAIPTAYYIGLSKSAPKLDGTNATEPPTTAGYARVKLENLSEPVNGVVTNSRSISFPKSTAGWGTVTHFAVYDSPTVGSGNLLMYGQLTQNRTVESATVLTIEANTLTLSAVNVSA